MARQPLVVPTNFYTIRLNDGYKIPSVFGFNYKTIHGHLELLHIYKMVHEQGDGRGDTALRNVQVQKIASQ
jgi:hypothetical protein